MVVALSMLAPAHAAPPPDAELMRTMLEGAELHQTVTLQEAGSKPRRVVVFDPRPGAKASYRMESSQTMEMSVVGPDGNRMTIPGLDMAPVTGFTMYTEVGEPLAMGQVPVSVRYGEVSVTGVPAVMGEQMLASLKVLDGLGFRVLFDEGARITADWYRDAGWL